MKTEVAILHHDYPTGVREHVESKLQELVKFGSDKVSMRALLERQRYTHRVEIIANVPHGRVLVADARAEGFGGALDEALSRMTRLLKRSREKRQTRHRRNRDRETL